jgi:ectoine hydroxylase-related dioxygenase (phytanoyl-CoA dioxygenase family)
MLAPQKYQYEKDGYLIVPNLFSPEEMQELSRVADKLLDGELKPDLPYKGKVADDFVVDFERELRDRNALPRRERVRLISWMCLHHSYFRHLAGHPAIYDVVASLYDSGVQIFSDTIFMKAAHHGSDIPPHQDSAFLPKIEPRALNFWMAIDAATVENGCLYILPGSHREELEHHTGGLVSRSLREDQADFSKQIPVELAPGDAIFFDSRLIHRSYPNRSTKSRRAMTAIYVADPVEYLEPWTLDYGFVPLDPPRNEILAV